MQKEYLKFRDAIQDVAKAEPISEVSGDTVDMLIEAAHRVVKKHDPRVARSKLRSGSIDGALGALVAAGSMAVANGMINRLPEVVQSAVGGEMESVITIGFGLAVTAIVVGLKRWFLNIRKHRRES